MSQRAARLPIASATHPVGFVARVACGRRSRRVLFLGSAIEPSDWPRPAGRIDKSAVSGAASVSEPLGKRRSRTSAVVFDHQILIGPIGHFGRIVRWAGFHLLPVDRQVNRSVDPLNFPDRPGRHQNVLSGPPIPGADHEVRNAPIRIIQEEILDMADLAVRSRSRWCLVLFCCWETSPKLSNVRPHRLPETCS